MELFGNPITGYSTEYYSKIIEEQRKANNNDLEGTMTEHEHYNSKYGLIKDNTVKYNRTQKK